MVQWQVWHQLHVGQDQPLNACSDRRMTLCHFSSISPAGSAMENDSFFLARLFSLIFLIIFLFIFWKVTFLPCLGKYCCSVASTVKSEKQLQVEVACGPSRAQAESKDAEPTQSAQTSSLHSHLPLEAGLGAWCGVEEEQDERLF